MEHFDQHVETARFAHTILGSQQKTEICFTLRVLNVRGVNLGTGHPQGLGIVVGMGIVVGTGYHQCGRVSNFLYFLSPPTCIQHVCLNCYNNISITNCQY